MEKVRIWVEQQIWFWDRSEIGKDSASHKIYQKIILNFLNWWQSPWKARYRNMDCMKGLDVTTVFFILATWGQRKQIVNTTLMYHHLLSWYYELVCKNVHFQQLRSNTIIHFELCLVNISPVFIIFKLYFWSLPPREISVSSAAICTIMFPGQPFGAGQVVYSGFLKLFCGKQLPTVAVLSAEAPFTLHFTFLL